MESAVQGYVGKSINVIYHFTLLQLLHSSDISDTSDINSDLYFFYFNYVSYFQIHPTISSPALTALLSLIPVLLNYHSLPYLFLVLRLSLTNLPLPYHTVLQTTSLCLSALRYINCSYFIVILQFVNCSQSKLFCLCNLVTNSNQLAYPLTLITLQLPTSYPSSEIKDMIKV